MSEAPGRKQVPLQKNLLWGLTDSRCMETIIRIVLEGGGGWVSPIQGPGVRQILLRVF